MGEIDRSLQLFRNFFMVCKLFATIASDGMTGKPANNGKMVSWTAFFGSFYAFLPLYGFLLSSKVSHP